MIDDLGWFDVLGLRGSESVISSFVAWMLREHPSMRRWLLEEAKLDDSDAEHDDWRAAREWFVGGAGNVDIVVRNRSLGLTFVIEHKVATRLSKNQLRKYVDAIREVTSVAGRSARVIPCLLTPTGVPHPIDVARDPSCNDAVQLDYRRFVVLAREIGALAPVAAACLDEMERLSSALPRPSAIGRIDRRPELLALVATDLGVERPQGTTLEIEDCTISVPGGARQCVSVRFARRVEPKSASSILDRAIEWADDHEAERVCVSVPWPEPGTDAPWAAELTDDALAGELLREQASIVTHIVRAAGRARARSIT